LIGDVSVTVGGVVSGKSGRSGLDHFARNIWYRIPCIDFGIDGSPERRRGGIAIAGHRAQSHQQSTIAIYNKSEATPKSSVDGFHVKLTLRSRNCSDAFTFVEHLAV